MTLWRRPAAIWADEDACGSRWAATRRGRKSGEKLVLGPWGFSRIWFQRARDVAVNWRKGGAFLGSAATRRWCTAFWVKQSGGRRRRLTAGRARRSQADASYLFQWSGPLGASLSQLKVTYSVRWAGAGAGGWSGVREKYYWLADDWKLVLERCERKTLLS